MQACSKSINLSHPIVRAFCLRMGGGAALPTPPPFPQTLRALASFSKPIARAVGSQVRGLRLTRTPLLLSRARRTRRRVTTMMPRWRINPPLFCAVQACFRHIRCFSSPSFARGGGGGAGGCAPPPLPQALCRASLPPPPPTPWYPPPHGPLVGWCGWGLG